MLTDLIDLAPSIACPVCACVIDTLRVSSVGRKLDVLRRI